MHGFGLKIKGGKLQARTTIMMIPSLYLRNMSLPIQNYLLTNWMKQLEDRKYFFMDLAVDLVEML